MAGPRCTTECRLREVSARAEVHVVCGRADRLWESTEVIEPV